MQKLTGFFYNPNEPEYVYEIKQNTDTNWLQEEPYVKYLVDTWELIKTDKNKSIYKTQGLLLPLQNFETSNLQPLNIKSNKLIGRMGLNLIMCLNDTKYCNWLDVEVNQSD